MEFYTINFSINYCKLINMCACWSCNVLELSFRTSEDFKKRFVDLNRVK